MPSLYDKIWDTHHVHSLTTTGEALLYVDLHLLHEVTSPQAFAGLDSARRKIRRPELALAVADHNVPTTCQELGIAAMTDPEAKAQMLALERNVARHGIELFPMGDQRNGIVHIVAPEQGRTMPGMLIVCGDSHTSTHGAFGALAHGIGSSEVEHVLATQTLRARKMRNMRINIHGQARADVTAKDLALALIAQIGTSGGTGHVIEFAGSAVTSLSMEARMTLCNMSVEAGARAGIIAPDDTTFAYLEGRPGAPKGREWQQALEYWRQLRSDDDAIWDQQENIDAGEIEPMISWGTSPEQAVPISGSVPDPELIADPIRRSAACRAIDYMGLKPGQKLAGLKIDRVFIGSCTNARIEDLRSAAQIIGDQKIAPHVSAMIVPGSGLVRARAEQEGLDQIFIRAGFEWRQPGCSMCLGMNPDRLKPKERCASTSNRNFEGRQGRLGRTHLLSPALAANAALQGEIAPLPAQTAIA